MTVIQEPCEDRDPEEYAGEEIPDPWSDRNQTDWPNEEVNTDGDGGTGASGV
jgi:hypothetical protein